MIVVAKKMIRKGEEICNNYGMHHNNQVSIFPPSSGIASCVGTVGTVMCYLHMTQPGCVALGRVLIWGLNPDWLRSFVNWLMQLV